MRRQRPTLILLKEDHMKRIVAALLSVLLLQLPTAAQAWFDMGQMTVAAAAYAKLDPAARAHVAELLKLNPDYDHWVAGVPAERRDMIAFVRASTWADDIKRRHDYESHSLSQDGEHAGDNVGYADFLVHPYWHFVDLPFSPDGTELVRPDSPNALTQIRRFRDMLASSASHDVKSYDLVWLLHLVGDAHQPLHATSRFTRGLPQGDRGGNLEHLCRAFTCGMKLHAFWDSLLGDKGRAEDAIVAAAALPTADPTLAGVSEPKTWFEEGAQLAQQVVYTDAIGDGTGPFTVDNAYFETATRVAQERAALAGVRLANLLNSALSQQTKVREPAAVP
jgi:hypothetical protein